MKGRVFSIEEFAVYDGPGIRTAVFLKGCPLDCSWCHNPEGKTIEKQGLRNPNGCLHCGECIRACPYNMEKCDGCGKCVEACPKGLMRVSGIDYEPETLTKILLKNERILKLNGGGITFSGGEPLLQADFVLEVAKLIDGRLSIDVETSGFCSPSKFEALMPYVDTFLFDFKVMDKEKALRYEGIDNSIILKNFGKLKESGNKFIARIPLIPGVIDTKENIKAIYETLKGAKGLVKITLEPYNRLAGAKYALAGREFKPDYDPEVPCRIPEANEFGELAGKVEVM